MTAVGLLALRLAYLAGPDLFPEEAYYWNYAKHLDFGYLDHPPLVAWLIYLGTTIFGDGEFGVRIFAVICSVITAIFAYLTTSFFFGRRAGVIGVLLVQVLPFFFMTGLIMTPDSSLTACWAGLLYFLSRALFDRSPRAWTGVGICLGLGLLSKYTIALVGLATLIFLLLDPPSRFWFRRAAPYAAVLLAALIFSPVIFWNAGHQWSSFAFQTVNRITAHAEFSLHDLAASVLLFLTPVCLIIAVRSLFGWEKAPRLPNRPVDDDARFLLLTRVFVLTPLVVFIFFSLGHAVKLNWTGPLWLALIPMLADRVASRTGNPIPLLRRGCVITAAFLCLTYFGFLHYLAYGLPFVRYSSDIKLLPVGWSEMGRALGRQKAELARANPGKTLIVGLDRNFIASEAAFYQADRSNAVRGTTGGHLFGGASLMYKSWFPAREQEGATLLLVSFDQLDLQKNRIREQSEELGPIQKYWIEREGIKIRPYYTRVAFRYCSTHHGHEDPETGEAEAAEIGSDYSGQ